MPGAPTTAVFPDTATDQPNSSLEVAAGSARVAAGVLGLPEGRGMKHSVPVMAHSPRSLWRPWVAAVVVAVSIAGSGCSSGSKASVSAPSSSSSIINPTSSTADITSTTPPTTATPQVGYVVPVSGQSDAAMRIAGNNGPSSSILVPSSCTVSSTRATATGTYHGRLAPEVYRRYGDVVDLYVFSAAAPGYPQGIQLAAPFSAGAPPIGGIGSWTVTVPIEPSLGRPVRCLIAAQPTHDFEGAPSAY